MFEFNTNVGKKASPMVPNCAITKRQKFTSSRRLHLQPETSLYLARDRSPALCKSVSGVPSCAITKRQKFTSNRRLHLQPDISIYLDIGEVQFIHLAGNKRLLMVNKYTFAQTTPRHFYCSKKSKGCKAKIFLDQEETDIVYSSLEHDHGPPVYIKFGDNGYYMKLSS
ncbi:hypothetical protein evm_005188 [Chilo suppressalis]|nr:hypothetical protein evm_005188 [Chilo suppressalis]